MLSIGRTRAFHRPHRFAGIAHWACTADRARSATLRVAAASQRSMSAFDSRHLAQNAAEATHWLRTHFAKCMSPLGIFDPF